MLRLYNTLPRKIVPFKPVQDRKVKMFTCGPSIYRLPHIGNYRTFLFEDILQRYLEYLGYEVTRLLAITDVEDKAIEESERKKMPLKKLTKENLRFFLKDMEDLKVRKPTYISLSSSTIEQSVKLIKKLLQKKFAYWYEGNVYADPLRFKDFGKLAKLDLRSWPKKKHRFHRDTYPGIRWNRGDFILWHGRKRRDKVFWATDIGEGRPSWNIQDAAMISKHFGATIDIACGGIDSLARHHDYTISIMEGIFKRQLARYWLHGAHLFIKKMKMSKSKGNVYYPRDLLNRGFSREHIRFFLISEHYRKKVNFTTEKLRLLSARLDSFKAMVDDLKKSKSNSAHRSSSELIKEVRRRFENDMNNDLDVNSAFKTLYSITRQLHNHNKTGKFSKGDARKFITELQKIDKVLQIIF
ncbi:class I tRNA ligase family protein [[Eubacterium] cellulosolvens]